MARDIDYLQDIRRKKTKKGIRKLKETLRIWLTRLVYAMLVIAIILVIVFYVFR